MFSLVEPAGTSFICQSTYIGHLYEDKLANPEEQSRKCGLFTQKPVLIYFLTNTDSEFIRKGVSCDLLEATFIEERINCHHTYGQTE